MQHVEATVPAHVYAPRITPNYSARWESVLRGRRSRYATAGSSVAIVNETMARACGRGRNHPVGNLYQAELGRGDRPSLDLARRAGLPAAVDCAIGNYVPLAMSPSRDSDRVKPLHAERGAHNSAGGQLSIRLPVGMSKPSRTSSPDGGDRASRRRCSRHSPALRDAAAVGLFAVVGGWVTERTPEIGVRIALGAGRGTVLRFFLARGAILTVVGVMCGLALAALTTRFLTAWLVDASPLDRPTFAAAAATMAAVGLLSTYLARTTCHEHRSVSALRS